MWFLWQKCIQKQPPKIQIWKKNPMICPTHDGTEWLLWIIADWNFFNQTTPFNFTRWYLDTNSIALDLYIWILTSGHGLLMFMQRFETFQLSASRYFRRYQNEHFPILNQKKSWEIWNDNILWELHILWNIKLGLQIWQI